MPIYMDVHIVPGVKAKDVAEAHMKDVLVQNEHNCKCLTYWIDEERDNVFCLIEAPGKEAVEEMHSRSHGLIPNKVIEVNSAIVESFLGRIYDPDDVEITPEGLKIFNDPSFRILLLSLFSDPVLLRNKLGEERANELVQTHNAIIRRNIAHHRGREVEHDGIGFIVSFTTASNAIAAAEDIQKEMLAMNNSGICQFRMALNAGEPLARSDKLFGDTIRLGRSMCAIAKNFQVAIASSVRNLTSNDHFKSRNNNFLSLPLQDETALELLYNKLEENWQDEQFGITEFCQATAMSKSQLYRKTISLTGMSPNILLKEFRLDKAKEMMNKQRYNISQITFDSGFTSPSYFTKCFKKKFGLLPLAYMDLLH